MRHLYRLIPFTLLPFILSACATMSERNDIDQPMDPREQTEAPAVDYSARMPAELIPPPGEKVVVVDPAVHAWGAYDSDGRLVKGGLATSGADWCPDINRACHTKSGTFRVNTLGPKDCKSTLFPVHKGGAPMPYCMFFNKGQALHGSYETGDANMSHGCVRLRIPDAEWLRFNFVNVGTKVIVKPYATQHKVEAGEG